MFSVFFYFHLAGKHFLGDRQKQENIDDFAVKQVTKKILALQNAEQSFAVAKRVVGNKRNLQFFANRAHFVLLLSHQLFPINIFHRAQPGRELENKTKLPHEFSVKIAIVRHDKRNFFKKFANLRLIHFLAAQMFLGKSVELKNIFLLF
jgi:hypothetical protein